MRTTADMLDDIPGLATEAWLTWGTHPAPTTHTRRRVPGSRVLADLDRLITLSTDPLDGLGILTTWAAAISREMTEADHPHTPPAPGLTATCHWLRDATRWSTGRGYASDFHADVRRLWATLRAICRVSPTTPIRCTTCGAATYPQGDMLTCPNGHEQPGAHRAVAHYLRRPSLPTDTICAEFGCTPQQLRDWRRRRKLHPDLSKGLRPLHWWPIDVLAAMRPDVRDALDALDTPTAHA